MLIILMLLNLPNYPILAQAGVKIKYQKQYLKHAQSNKKLKLFSY